MAAPTPQQRSLLERIRRLIDAEPDVREVSMFGGRAIMLGSTMVVSVGKDGSLLVRADADDHEALLSEPGTAQAEMGAGRTMGPGWIRVRPDAIDADDRLVFWVNTAMTYNRVITSLRS
ncbi:TfoX/Sxy family protein [Actinomyces howellii]|uniref:Regulator of competence-specific genes n=1 Tax=Actinomyces howellii TaxID=52771 RepID=A0A3S4R9B3_9ACTO|nr:TfoX/Sxy family protein [Actinomyces howellii]VEG25652.1 Regulator of competence-specific genes [Actinomyces howellii]